MDGNGNAPPDSSRAGHKSKCTGKCESSITPTSAADQVPLPDAQDVSATLQANIDMLAGLDLLTYERMRTKAAEDLGLRVGMLDTFVDASRDKQFPASDDAAEGKGCALKLREFELWDRPVAGCEVLDETLAHIARHMFIDQHQAEAVALWVAHAHMYSFFPHTPRLLITAPEAECGKTMLMAHLIGRLVPKPQVCELMKAAPFFRLAQKARPTFLIDEMDVFIEQDSDLLAAVNNGWEPHGGVLRCVGDEFDVTVFSTHTPVVMAGIELEKKLPATTVSRSVIVSLERAMADEISGCDEFDSRKHSEGILETGRKLARWAVDHRDDIASLDPTLPPKVRNRLADKWRPLFAIAQAAGGGWPERARSALFAQPDLSEPSKALQLLMDTQDVLKGRARNIATVDLIRLLAEMEETLWADYNFKGRDEDERRIKPRQLANLFKTYRIESGPVRTLEKPGSAKGYKECDLKAAFQRYCPKDPPEKGSQGHNAYKTTAYSRKKGHNPIGDVTHRSTREPSKNGGCDPVTPQNVPTGGPEGVSRSKHVECSACSRWVDHVCKVGFVISDPHAPRVCEKFDGGPQ